MSEPVRLGVLGCADIAVRRVLPAVRRSPALTLAAVASRAADRAREVADAFGGDPVTGYQALLDRADVTAVYVPLPAALHARWVRRALLAGKHVLAEKPLTTDAGQTASLVALARSRGLVLRENVMFPQHPQHQRVRELLAGGAVGRLWTLSAAFTIPPRPPDDIRYRADLGGGALLDVGYYPLRAALFLLGDQLDVAGAVLHGDPERGVDVAGAVLLRRPDGVSAHLTFGMDHHYTAHYQVLGSAGRLRLERAFTPPADHAPTVVVERPDGVERHRLAPYDQVRGTVESFAAAVRAAHGRPAAPRGAGGADDDPATAALLRQAELTAEVQRLAGTARPGPPEPDHADHAAPSPPERAVPRPSRAADPRGPAATGGRTPHASPTRSTDSR